uniref:Portal protein n=1 Tax=Podoviridae sp. ctylN24 TaxID=2827756 RepID=A0A8S5SXQ1_9CAUD|nr:MAG TPA: Portal protein [Podoviridae sp. ctylN24]
MTDEIELNDERADKLADLVQDRYQRAASARSSREVYRTQSVDFWLREAYERFLGKACNNRFNLTRIKAGALYAKVKDMVVNSADAPFVVEATPIPTLSKKQTGQVQEVLERLLGEKLMEAGIVLQDADGNVWPNYDAVIMADGYTLVPSVAAWLKEQAVEQKQTILTEAGKVAREAIKQVTTLMQDQMLEGGWRDAYLDVLFDVFLYGTGVLRCELRRVQGLKWNGDKLAPSTDDIMTWRHVPVGNCYPSADSESAQEGTYFIERGAMRKQDLFACAQIDWMRQDKIAEAYEQARDNAGWLEREDVEQPQQWADDALVDVLIHEGTVRGDTLMDWLDDDAGIDENAFYDVEAWVLAGVTIGCRVLKHPHGTRSYFSANFQRAGRNFWGIGAGMTLASIEDTLNGLLDDLAQNLELTVAPPIFYDVMAFDNADDVTLKKRARIPFNPDPVNRTMQPFFQPRFDSKSGELINLFNWFYRLADDESGIPGLLSGNDRIGGGEATFRGMKMLAASANTLVKAAFLNIDQTMIQPAMQWLWRWNMLNSKEEGIRADVRVVARGAAGLMQKEIADAERADVLPLLMQLIQGAGLPPEETQRIMQYLLQQTMAQGGMPVDELMSDPALALQQAGAVQSLQPATPLPTIGSDTDTGGLNVS